MRLKATITILTATLIISCELSITPEEWSSTNNRPYTTRSISDAKKIAIEALAKFTQEGQTKTSVC